MTNTQKVGRTVTDKEIVLLLLCIAFSLFLFDSSTRSILSENKINVYFNLLYILFGALTIIILIINECLDIGIVLVVLAFIGMTIITLLTANQKLFHYLLMMQTMLLPFITSAIRLPEACFEIFLEKFIKATNVVCLFLVGIAILDYLSGTKIQMFCIEYHIFINEQGTLARHEHLSGIYRYYSIIGHPLVTAWYLLVFYTLNILYNRYFKPLLNEYFLTLVTLIGLILCGSRTALLIALFMIIFLNKRKNQVTFFLLLSVIIAGLAMTPMFQENLMQRFFIGLTPGSVAGISEGRNRALSLVFNGFIEPPAFFIGGGLGYSRQVTIIMGGFIKSFEYPFLMFPYDVSILGTILIYTVILGIPIYIILKNRSYCLAMFFVMLTLYVNGFNDLANYSDFMGQFCFIIMVLVNISYVIKRKRENLGKHEKSYNC